MRSNKRVIFSLSIAAILYTLNLFILEEQARGDTHFIESLALIRFDEKVMAQNFSLNNLNGNLVHRAQVPDTEESAVPESDVGLAADGG